MRISDWSSDVCSSDLTIHSRCREHMGAVDGHTLRLVDRRRIAVIKVAIIFHVERDTASIIGAHRHALLAYALDRPERAVFDLRSEEHTSELQSLMRISYAVFCLKKKNHILNNRQISMNPSTH